MMHQMPVSLLIALTGSLIVPVVTSLQRNVLDRLRATLQKYVVLSKPLPSGRSLAREWKTSFSLVQRSLLVLQAQGLVTRRGNKFWAISPTAAPAPGTPLLFHLLASTESLIQNVLRTANERRGEVQVSMFDAHNMQTFSPSLRKVMQLKPAGLIVQSPLANLLTPLKAATYPVVVVGAHCQGCLSISHNLSADLSVALHYLRNLGHSSISFLTSEDPNELAAGTGSRAEMFRTECRRLHLRGLVVPVEWRQIGWQQCFEDSLTVHKQAIESTSALVCLATGIAEIVRTWARKQKWPIPKKLSLLSLDIDGADAVPGGLTVVRRCSPAESARLATLLLIDHLQHQASGKPFIAHQICLQAEVAAGATTGPPCRTQPRGRLEPSGNPTPAGSTVDGSLSGNGTYLFISRHSGREMIQVNLGLHCNRSLIRLHGWIGQLPLLHLPPGLRTIHGVDFRILDEKTNGGFGYIAMASLRAHTGAGEPLPQRLRVSCRLRARALYFLHSCAFAEHGQFANYRVVMNDRSGLNIPLVALGVQTGSARDWKRQLAASNLQDWWYELPQFSGKHFRNFVVAPINDPASYTRYLYTMEWVNPQPEQEIREIEISSDPKAKTTLGLLALTALV